MLGGFFSSKCETHLLDVFTKPKVVCQTLAYECSFGKAGKLYTNEFHLEDTMDAYVFVSLSAVPPDWPDIIDRGVIYADACAVHNSIINLTL